MTLTMTRTRTQTTLTKLAELVANVHGELAFVDGLLPGVAGKPLEPDVKARLDARKLKLASDRAALYATIRQFDAAIDPEAIGVAEAWRKRYGKGLSSEGLVRRYLSVVITLYPSLHDANNSRPPMPDSGTSIR